MVQLYKSEGENFMKHFSKLLLFTLIAISLSAIGWNVPSEKQSSAITDHYYYHGHKYYLQHKADKLYIKLRSELSRENFLRSFLMLAGFPLIIHSKKMIHAR